MYLMNLLRKYCIFGMTVGYFSKLFETWDAKIQCHVDEKIIERDMLMGEKVGVCIFGVITGPIMLPLKILDLMNRADIAIKGHTPHMYGYPPVKNRISDYLF